MIEYDEGCPLATLLRWRGSVVPRAFLYAVPAPLLAAVIILCEDMYPDAMLHLRLVDISVGHIYTASTAAIMLLLAFRTSQAHARYWEGTSLLHQMQGEWFDSVSCLFTFSRGALDERRAEVQEFRHTLVRLMSLCHGSALEEIKEGSADEVEVLDINGLDQQTLRYLDQCKMCFDFNRVEVLLHMIQVLTTNAQDNGVITVAPPILSRVYQTLSRGLVNLLNVMKIKHTSFPFPWLISLAIFVLTIWTPFLVTSVVKSYWLACFMAFVPVFGMASLNTVAIELERPFGNDMNDLPLDHFQRHMNNGLLMLLHESSDIVPHTSPHCKMSLDEIMGEAIKCADLDDFFFNGTRLSSPVCNAPSCDSLTPISSSLGVKRISSISNTSSAPAPSTSAMSVQHVLSASGAMQAILSGDSSDSRDGPPDGMAPEEEGAPSSPPATRRNMALLQNEDGNVSTEAGSVRSAALRTAQDTRVGVDPPRPPQSPRREADHEASVKVGRRRATVSSSPVANSTTQVQRKLIQERQSQGLSGQGQGRGISGLDWVDSDLRFDKLFQLWAQKADAHLEALRQNTAVIAERMVPLSRKGPLLHGGQEAPQDWGQERIQGPQAYLGS